MDATKTSFDLEENQWVEKAAHGAVPALKWTDSSGNNFRALGLYVFDNLNEIYTVRVLKQIQPIGLTKWIEHSQYNLTADKTKYRILGTGEAINGLPRGKFSAAAGLFPETGGSGIGDSVQKGDRWIISEAGSLGSLNVVFGDIIWAITNTPGQDNTKWALSPPAALDSDGNIIDPTGWVYNGKYFTICVGFNPAGIPISINSFVYFEIAEEEGLTII